MRKNTLVVLVFAIAVLFTATCSAGQKSLQITNHTVWNWRVEATQTAVGQENLASIQEIPVGPGTSLTTALGEDTLTGVYVYKASTYTPSAIFRVPSRKGSMEGTFELTINNTITQENATFTLQDPDGGTINAD